MKTKSICLAIALASVAIGTAQAKGRRRPVPERRRDHSSPAPCRRRATTFNYFGNYHGQLRNGDGDKVPGASTPGSTRCASCIPPSTRSRRLLGLARDPAGGAPEPFTGRAVRLGHRHRRPSPSTPSSCPGNTKNWHWAVAARYQPADRQVRTGDPRTRIGTNYWSVEPIFAVSYMGRHWLEASAKFMYNIKGKNGDFRPAPGAPKMKLPVRRRIPHGLPGGQALRPWGVGVSGYYQADHQRRTRRHEDFLGAGAVVRWSQGQVFAYGPSVSYTNKAGMHFIGQWQRETNVENRFGGDKVWFS